MIPQAEILRIIATCEGKSDERSRRDAALILLMLDTGARAQEVVGITLGDIDLDRGIIRLVRTKGKRVRNVSIGSRTTRALDRYLRVRPAHRFAELPEAFLGVRGRLTVSGLAQILEARCSEAGVTKQSPHKWRHAAAHLSMAGGATENELMQQFGWRSAAMTRRYGSALAEERAIVAHKTRYGAADRLGIKKK